MEIFEQINLIEMKSKMKLILKNNNEEKIDTDNPYTAENDKNVLTTKSQFSRRTSEQFHEGLLETIELSHPNQIEQKKHLTKEITPNYFSSNENRKKPVSNGFDDNINKTKIHKPIKKMKKVIKTINTLKSNMTILGSTKGQIKSNKKSPLEKNFEKTKEFEFTHYQYELNALFQCIFSLISITSAIIEYESTVMKTPFSNNTLLNIPLDSDQLSVYGISEGLYKNAKQAASIAGLTCFFSSVCLWVTILYDFFLHCKLMFINKKLSESVWMKEAGNILSLFTNLIMFFIHPTPFTYGINLDTSNDKYEIEYKIPLNGYFCVICLFRAWFFIKFLFVSSVFYSPRTQRVCDMNSFDSSLGFSMKGIMKKKPFNIYTLLFILVLIICSYSLRIFERSCDKDSGIEFSNFWNSLWCVFTTMTTVGYGDYTPSTWAGRIIIIFGCFCGVFLVSMLIVSISNLLNFEGNEQNIYLLLERIELMAEKNAYASKLVAQSMQLTKLMKKEKTKVNKGKENLFYTLYSFKEKCKEIDSTFNSHNNLDSILNNLDYLEKALEYYDTRFNKIDNIVEKIASKLNINTLS